MKVSLLCCMLLCFGMTGYSQSQSDMNRTATQEFRTADKQLNEVYQQIMKDYAANKPFIKNMKDAQRVWIQFRDAQMKARFPESPRYYGSSYPACYNNYLAELTRQRVEALREWLSGVTEGDVCGGSVGAKN